MIALLILALLSAPALAHDPYTRWNTFTGASCCNQRDCAPVPHQVRADGLYLLVNGQWWRANNQEAREQQPIDDQAHACVLTGQTKPICWAPPWSGA